MLISRENLRKVGLMKENYFLYYEEIDWGARIKNSGYKIGVCTSSEITHKSSATIQKVSECKLYFQTRNRILFARVHFPTTHKFLFTVFFALVSTPKNIVKFMLRRDFQSIRTFWEAIKWHFHNKIESKRLGYKFDSLLK